MDTHPVTTGLLPANQVIVDRATLKPSLVGIFSGLGVEGFPSSSQRFSVWSPLTHGAGSGRIELWAFSSRTREQIYLQGGTIRFSDVTDVVYTSFRVRTIRFPHPGYYIFRLFIDDIPVPRAVCRLRVYRSEVTDD